MRIFLTGATGYIGSAVLDALLRAGHQVTALVRDAVRGAPVVARGAQRLIGDLADPASYVSGLDDVDGYVLTAFDPSPQGPALDRLTLDTVLSAARARGLERRFVVYTSGAWVLGPTDAAAAEDAPLNPPAIASWRPAHERLVLSSQGAGLRTMVIRPGLVYGGRRGIVSDLIKDAANGIVRVIGTGANHCPFIYDRDLADLYARLIADPDAAGVFHANDEGDERVIDIVEAVSGQVPVRPSVRHVPIEEARAKMGPVADALVLDQKMRSPRARALGWQPTLRGVGRSVPRLLEELRDAQAPES